jgi:pimeloyl-ACP methyl ester carboxylesterase
MPAANLLTQDLPAGWAHREAVVNGVRLHYVEAGAGPLVVLLHGFPEFWYSWHRQIGELSAAGFHVLAPDLRGYNLSDKPRGVNAYRVEALTADVAGLIRHVGEQSAAVVGHDWGGVLAWLLPLHYPEMVQKRIILNAPHPAALRREIHRGVDQLLRSWYIFFFQLPLLPEALMRGGDFALLHRMLTRQPVRPGAFTADDLARYRQALARPGALTAAINWYRAAFRRPPQPEVEDVPCAVPTLVIWGERDVYLGPRLTERLEQWSPNLCVERIPDASHWVQNDAPERVNELMIEFLRSNVQLLGDRPSR